MTKQVDLNAYNDFVKKVTSGESQTALCRCIMRLILRKSGMKVNAALLMTGAIGMAVKEENLLKLLKNVSPVNPMDDETIFIVNENLVILCGIGLLVGPVLVWILTK